ncbi:MAG: hypothetical protein ABJN26_24430 [Stappiaceae bacterium]
MERTLATETAPAAADTTLNTQQLDGLLRGNTLYLSLPAGGPGGESGGVAPFFYGSDGRAVAKLPAGMTLVGIWSLGDEHYCVNWDNGPKNSCTKVRKWSSDIVLTDAQSGDIRGNVVKLVPGNPENL